MPNLFLTFVKTIILKTKYKIENLLLILAIVLYFSFKIIGAGMIFFTVYVALLAVYFFPIKLFIEREEITIPKVFTYLTLGLTLNMSAVMLYADKTMSLSIISLVALLSCLVFLVYYLFKKNYSLAASMLLANTILGFMTGI